VDSGARFAAADTAYYYCLLFRMSATDGDVVQSITFHCTSSSARLSGVFLSSIQYSYKFSYCHLSMAFFKYCYCDESSTNEQTSSGLFLQNFLAMSVFSAKFCAIHVQSVLNVTIVTSSEAWYLLACACACLFVCLFVSSIRETD